MDRDFDLALEIKDNLTTASGECVQFDDHWWTWQEVASVAESIEQLLAEGCIERGLPVGLVLTNSPAGYAAVLSLISAERPVALISPFQSSSGVAADVSRLGLAAIIADEESWQSESLREAVDAGGSMGISISPRGLERPLRICAADHRRAADWHREPEIAVQLLTSGTTGVPKRVRYDRRGFSRAIADQIELGRLMGEAPGSAAPSATMFQYAPMVQVSGFCTALQSGAEGRRLVMSEKFSASAWLKNIRENRQTMLPLPPAMMRMVLEANPTAEDFSSLKSVRSGAAPLDDFTRERFERDFGVPILGVYGATEFMGPIASWSLEDHAIFGAAKRGSVGRVWPEIANVRVVDPVSGNELSRGEAGLLEVQVHRIGPDWLRTNDLAVLDSDGFLFIKGRADDAINRGGFKIPPEVIADALRKHPAVFDAAVTSLPDPRLGQVPVAAVEVRPQTSRPSEAELLGFARANLIAYQVPVKILVLDALPRTPMQKISRPGLDALFERSDR